MTALLRATFLALSLSATGHALGKPVILADSNRDGQVTKEGDYEDRATWTEERGAMFLPNIVDTNNRCAQFFADNPNEAGTDPDKRLANCNDADGTILYNDAYVAQLKVMPNSDVPSNVRAEIRLDGSRTAVGGNNENNKNWSEKVQIFRKMNNKWDYVYTDADNGHQPTAFTPADLQDGLELGIDARDVRRPNEWDGLVTVTIAIIDAANGKDLESDSVQLRVAPVLIQHARQDVETVFSVSGSKLRRKGAIAAQDSFVAEVGQKMALVELDKNINLEIEGEEVFIQDSFESGYASIPGSNGPVVIGIMIRSGRNEEVDRQVFTKLRSGTVGAVQLHGNRKSQNGEGMGNVEAIPPHIGTDNMKYPAGRAVIGYQDGEARLNIHDFLEAQGYQRPLSMKLPKLNVGHIDELMQFVPFEGRLGWKVLVVDPAEGVRLLQEELKKENGAVTAFSRPALPNDPAYFNTIDWSSRKIENVLNLPKFTQINQEISKIVDQNIDLLKRETGIDEQDIIRVPLPFYKHGNKRLSLDPEWDTQDLYSALWPNPVNGLLLKHGTKQLYLSPNTWGPKIGENDIFASEMSTRILRQTGIRTGLINDYFTHFERGGDVHCGTNVARAFTDADWWNSAKSLPSLSTTV